MTFLPKEFSCSNEWGWVLELPSHYIGPLIEAQRKISMWVDPLCIAWIHNCLTGRSDGNRFLKISFSWLCNPRHFGSEALNVIFFFTKSCFRYKHGEIAIRNSVQFEARIKEILNAFPDKVSQWSEDITSWDFIVLYHLTLSNHLLIPLWEVLFLSVLNTKLMNILLGFFFLFMLCWLLRGSFLFFCSSSISCSNLTEI